MRDVFKTNKLLVDSYFRRNQQEITNMIRTVIFNKKYKNNLYVTNLEDVIDLVKTELYIFFLYKKELWYNSPLDQMAHIVYFFLYKKNDPVFKKINALIKADNSNNVWIESFSSSCEIEDVSLYKQAITNVCQQKADIRNFIEEYLYYIKKTGKSKMSNTAIAQWLDTSIYGAEEFKKKAFKKISDEYHLLLKEDKQ